MNELTNSICKTCWSVCFSREDFQKLCSSGDGATVSYATDLEQTSKSASIGCQWCTFILEINEQSQDLIPLEYRFTSSSLEVRLRTGIFEEIYTPHGNNRLTLSVNGAVTHLSLFTTEKNAASDAVTARPCQTDVTSDLAFQGIHQWLNQCATHTECLLPQLDSPLPTRLIDVDCSTTHSSPRLVLTKGLHARYAALSYCWGGKQIGMTLRENISSRLLELNEEDLSKTVQQAIWVTRRLGVRYLWVDAICIIQNCEEDRTNEIRQMCDIYRRAYLTIVAASASHSSDGFLQQRPSPSPPTQIPFWSKNLRLGSAWVRQEGWYEDSSEPINSRAWTLQERLLSRKLIIFASHTVQLQCQLRTVNLGDSLNIPAGLTSWRLPLNLMGPPNVQLSSLSTEAVMDAWKAVITLYSERILKRDQERLVALAGLAQAFHEVLQVPYLAGLWSGSAMPAMLLWETRDYPRTPQEELYIAPSWSWVSLLVPIRFRNVLGAQNMKPCNFEILSCTTMPLIPSLPLGKISSGSIVAIAHIKLALFVPPNELQWKDMSSLRSTRPSIPQSGIFSHDYVPPDIMTNVQFDHKIPRERMDVTCLALVCRSYNYEGASYAVVDGLLIQPKDQSSRPDVYQRIGCFFGAMQEDFATSEKIRVILE
jgi:Heterokaryon incompatibility protein (HET)